MIITLLIICFSELGDGVSVILRNYVVVPYRNSRNKIECSIEFKLMFVQSTGERIKHIIF